MKAEITIAQLWYNPNVMNFFFRSQAEANFSKMLTETFEESTEEVLSAMDSTYEDLDEFEEMMYNLYADDLFEEIAEETGLTLIQDENEDED